MSQSTRYAVGDLLNQVCGIAKISAKNVLRRAGLPADFIEQSNSMVDIAKFFELWNAVEKEAKSIDSILAMGIAYARGPFASPVFAFSCSETVESGIARLAEFKPLIGPLGVKLERNEDSLTITHESLDPDHTLPATFGLLESTYIIECARNCTAEPIVPLVVTCPSPDSRTAVFSEYFGVTVTNSDECKIVFSDSDAKLPLLTRNDSLWSVLGPELSKQLEKQHDSSSTKNRVKEVIVATLAGGAVSSDLVAKKLYLSKRSMQRKLNEEGTTFQKVITETRIELSEHYLAKPEISLTEISYLLGFKDQTSYFRAHQDWLGMTPLEMRK